MNLQAINSATQGKTRTSGVSPFLELEISKVYPNPNQPRKHFEAIDELANSIKENGLIQPIAVVKTDKGYMIISGERRYRACQSIGLKTIKAHTIQADEKKVQELALVENIQRDDLTDFEKAKFINQLWASGYYAKKQDLAKAIGKSPTYISKVFKAIKISDEIIADIEEHKKDIGLEVLQELSNVKDKDVQLQLYQDGAKRDDIRTYNESQKSSSKFSPAKKTITHKEYMKQQQKLSSEDIIFIKNLSNEINTQDNRCTAKPFTYRIQQSQKVISLDSSQYNNIGITIDDDYYDDIEDCFEYVEECVNEENESDDYYVQIITKSELEDYLDELGKDYNYYSWQYEDRLCSSSQGGTNCFLTEKACEDFIKSNSHNLSNPKSYVVHEFRNNEMKQLIELVHKLAKIL